MDADLPCFFPVGGAVSLRIRLPDRGLRLSSSPQKVSYQEDYEGPAEMKSRVVSFGATWYHGMVNETEFYKATQSRALKGPYLLHGEEELTKADAVSRVKKLLDPGMLALNCQSLRTPDVESLLSAADQLPFFDELRLVLVESWDDALIDALEKRNRLLTLGETTVVLFIHRGECRKTNRLFKALAPENRVVAFERLTMDRAVNMLLRESALKNVDLNRATTQTLVERVGFDAYRLRNEFSKAADYVGPGGAVTGKVLDLVVTPSPEYNAFEMLDALLAGQRKKGYAMLLGALDRGETPMGLAGFLEGRLKLILTAREHLDRGLDARAAARQLPGSPYAAQIAVKNAQKRTARGLRRAVAAFASVDGNIKQGIYKDRDALLLAVLNTFEQKEEVNT